LARLPDVALPGTWRFPLGVRVVPIVTRGGRRWRRVLDPVTANDASRHKIDRSVVVDS
jgi:hypothetical protein